MITLSTHVLDIMHGCPAAGMKLQLMRQTNNQVPEILYSGVTNDDGRCGEFANLMSVSIDAGAYILLFDAANYFRSKNVILTSPAFLEQIPIWFTMADVSRHYHVPLLLSPYAYSTYRGS